MNAERNTSERQAHDGLLERPLGPRSLVASLLLGMDPPRLDPSRLVRWCELFGVQEGTTRVALSRMTAAGELRARNGRYELAGELARRQRRQEQALRDDPATRAWDGSWRVLVVTADGRDAEARRALRDELRRAHFAEQREGVWARPDNLADVELPHAQAQCFAWPATPDDPQLLAHELFALDAWARDARRSIAALDQWADALTRRGAEALPHAFYAGAAAVAVLARDPRLPRALLPRDWPGPRLRSAYASFQPVFAASVERWRRDDALAESSGRAVL